MLYYHQPCFFLLRLHYNLAIMKNIYLSLISGFLFTACSLDRVPYDALSTATFPKTEADVEMLAVGCYDGYANQDYTIYNDVFSDNGYCAINTCLLYTSRCV